MKKIVLLILLFSCRLTFAQEVSFSIIKEKTKVDTIGIITLHVEVINKSANPITILKPATDFNEKWRYYDVNMECENMPMFSTEIQENRFAYSHSDLLVVASNSKVEIIINGRYNTNALACNSKEFQLKLVYDASALIECKTGKFINLNEQEIVKKLSPIRIESLETKIKVL